MSLRLVRQIRSVAKARTTRFFIENVEGSNPSTPTPQIEGVTRWQEYSGYQPEGHGFESRHPHSNHVRKIVVFYFTR